MPVRILIPPLASSRPTRVRDGAIRNMPTGNPAKAGEVERLANAPDAEEEQGAPGRQRQERARQRPPVDVRSGAVPDDTDQVDRTPEEDHQPRQPRDDKQQAAQRGGRGPGGDGSGGGIGRVGREHAATGRQ